VLRIKVKRDRALCRIANIPALPNLNLSYLMSARYVGPMGKILIIEDEKDIRELMKFQLNSSGYQVTDVDSADKAIELLESGQKFDLILVDWMLPGISGIEFTRRLKGHKSFKTLPIIMRAVPTIKESKPITFDELEIDLAKVKVLVSGEEITLTSTEFKILGIISSKPGHVFTRTQLISQIQGENIHVTGRTVDTHIAGLRKKLSTAGRLVETIRGIGYRFKDGI
jgi:two-component system, OmpR family, alkaline phosphatase synthesis response regulator PhoP